MLDHKTPIKSEIQRIEMGQEEDINGKYFHSLTFNGKQYYINEFQDLALMDEEIAVAEMLVKMTEYVHSGKNFYSLAAGCHDQYLALLLEESQKKKEEISSSPQSWTSYL